MAYNNSVKSIGNSKKDNIFINKGVIQKVVDVTETDNKFDQDMKVNVEVALPDKTNDDGTNWTRTLYLGGNFEKDTINGTIIGPPWQIQDLIAHCNIKFNISDTGEWDPMYFEACKGKEIQFLTYKSKTGINKTVHAVKHIRAKAENLKKAFIRTHAKGKYYQDWVGETTDNPSPDLTATELSTPWDTGSSGIL